MPIDTQKAAEQFERYVYLRDNGHSDFVTKATECSRFYRGKQWEEAVERRLEARRKPVLTINLTLATISALQALYLNNRVDVAFRPATAEARADTATALNKAYLHFTQRNNFSRLESQLFDHGVIRSRSFIDVRVEFDENLKGYAKAMLLNGKNVVIDDEADEYDPDTWEDVFITKWFTRDQIALLYNEKDAKYLGTKPQGSPWVVNVTTPNRRPSLR